MAQSGYPSKASRSFLSARYAVTAIVSLTVFLLGLAFWCPPQPIWSVEGRLVWTPPAAYRSAAESTDEADPAEATERLLRAILAREDLRSAAFSSARELDGPFVERIVRVANGSEPPGLVASLRLEGLPLDQLQRALEGYLDAVVRHYADLHQDESEGSAANSQSRPELGGRLAVASAPPPKQIGSLPASPSQAAWLIAPSLICGLTAGYLVQRRQPRVLATIEDVEALSTLPVIAVLRTDAAAENPGRPKRPMGRRQRASVSH